jgi:SAM-dependent methyltransferase
MSREERAAWDERFRTGDHAGTEPDPFLLELDEYSDFFPQRRQALDVACGAGRNAVWLVEHAWQVTAVDISLQGLGLARELALEHGVHLDLLCLDLDAAPALPANHFDLVICFFYLQRSLFPQLHSTLRPGGIIVYKTYTLDQPRFSGGPRHPMHLLEPQELLTAFEGFRVLCYRERIKGRGVAELIAQKPR